MALLLSWIVAIPLLGFVTGLRSMTPIALVCLFAWRGHLDVEGTWAFWSGYGISAAIFAVLAVGEWIGDKLPMTPNRTAWFPLAGRILFGGLVGAICATSLQGSLLEGVLLGAVSAFAGTFAGFHVRQRLVRRAGFRDLYVALCEDALGVMLSLAALAILRT